MHFALGDPVTLTCVHMNQKLIGFNHFNGLPCSTTTPVNFDHL